MAVENVIAFWRKVQSSKELQDRLAPGHGIPALTKGARPDELAGLAEIAGSEGCPCTPDELLAVENVLSFLEALPKNAELRNAVSECEAMENQQGIAATVRIAGQHGYAFAAQDLVAVLSSSQAGLLSDTELESVAGGVSPSLSAAKLGGFSFYRLGRELPAVS